mgnify:CR=1 FL=1
MFFDNISIPEKYVGLVIGKRGSTVRKIEIKFNVKILIDKNIFYLYCLDSEKILQEECCPICLESLSMDKNYTITKCGHRFHSDCLAESLKNSEKCPLCREELTEKKSVDIEKIINKTLQQVRRTNYSFYLSYYLTDICSFQVVVEEFLREPLRYALSQI